MNASEDARAAWLLGLMHPVTSHQWSRPAMSEWNERLHRERDKLIKTHTRQCRLGYAVMANNTWQAIERLTIEIADEKRRAR